MNITIGLLSAAPTTQAAPLPFMQALMLALSGITIVVMALAFLAIMVLVMNKIVPSITGQNNAKPAAPAPVQAPAATAPVAEAKPAIPAGMVELPANQSQGDINLYSVDDKTAAMIMAIVSDTTKIPLNELYFKSIKEI